MKTILTVICLMALLACTEARAAIAVVQSISASTAGFTFVTTGNITTSSGNLVICDYGLYFQGTMSVTDSKSNTYTDVFGNLPSAYDEYFNGGQFYSANITGGASHNFTLTNSTSSYMSFICKEVSGASTSGVLDRTTWGNNDSSLTTGLTSGSTSTTTQAQELLSGGAIAANGSSNTAFTPTGGFTADQNLTDVPSSVIGLVSARRIVTVTGAYEFTYDLSAAPAVGSVAWISTWKESVAAPPAVARRRILIQP